MLPHMKELSVGEQRHKALLAVFMGSTVTAVAQGRASEPANEPLGYGHRG